MSYRPHHKLRPWTYGVSLSLAGVRKPQKRPTGPLSDRLPLDQPTFVRARLKFLCFRFLGTADRKALLINIQYRGAELKL